MSANNFLCEYCGKTGSLTSRGPIESLFACDITNCKIECVCDDCYLLALRFQAEYSQLTAESRLERSDAIAALKIKLKSQRGN